MKTRVHLIPTKMAAGTTAYNLEGEARGIRHHLVLKRRHQGVRQGDQSAVHNPSKSIYNGSAVKLPSV